MHKTLKKVIRGLIREWQSMTPISMPTSTPSTGNIYFNPTNIAMVRPGTEHLPQETRKAACCFIQRADGKILGVSRKYDPNAWGLPGGKVEENESIEDGAARELSEETGLTATSLKPIHSSIDADGFETTTFMCDVENINDIETSEEGRVKWITWNELLTGPFANYNQELYNVISTD
jgi:ADP-ribose pyrophosphatase YjhB (NUDIX family)